MNIADIAVVAVIAAIIFFSVRSLLRANKNGCSDCGGSCSGHDSGHCSKADQMLADASRALRK
ncbi:FeoB-associated Cys-rich membrane protein [Paratractidigestivibacter sp.]|uniref:FeoB-associated Cys-rich membrane protein n=1 Tax=Paratractidigestivibacter sp. TaxID=2847316 RepID=UPI002ABDF63F|nr:FeoB-associated Cys-rich membrane protein [Paratractidigestivibacter sp.]